MKKYLEKNIIPSYCLSYELVDDDHKSRLNKVFIYPFILLIVK